MSIRFLIVDDEPLARKLMASHASKIPDLECAGEFGSAMEALQFLRSQSVDLIFLDIQMPEINGLQFVKSLRHPPAIILTTAYRDFAAEAFDIEALDYLLKPIAFDRFFKAVSRLLDRKSQPAAGLDQITEIHLKSDRRIYKVRLDEILYVESLDDYVKVHVGDRFIVTRESISALEARLPADRFVRIHRSYLINRKEVASLSMEGVKLGDLELPFGRAFKKQALDKLNFRLGD